MKKLIFGAIALMAISLSSCLSEKETTENEQTSEGTYTPEVVCDTEDVVKKMPPEAHLYDADEYYHLLCGYLVSNSGTFYHSRQFDIFAGTYYKRRKVQVIDEAIYSSPGVCYLWLESYLGEKRCNELNLSGEDVINYIDGEPSKIKKGIIPDVKATKRLLRKYCHDVLLREYDKPHSGDLDPYVFSCTYDGLSCEDWVKRYWHKYTKISVYEVKYDKAQSTDSTDVYNVTFEFSFAENEQGYRFEDNLRLASKLTEYSNGKFEYGSSECVN